MSDFLIATLVLLEIALVFYLLQGFRLANLDSGRRGKRLPAAIKKEKDSGGSPGCAGVLVGPAIVHQGG